MRALFAIYLLRPTCQAVKQRLKVTFVLFLGFHHCLMVTGDYHSDKCNRLQFKQVTDVFEAIILFQSGLMRKRLNDNKI